MINTVTLTGRLTKDVELRYTPQGTAVASMTLAVDRIGDGTDFIRIVAFNKSAETMANHLGKGSLIGVEGRIQTGSYEDKDGKRVFTTDVLVNRFTFLESKREQQQQQQQEEPYWAKSAQKSHSAIDIDDDELPF